MTKTVSYRIQFDSENNRFIVRDLDYTIKVYGKTTGEALAKFKELAKRDE